MTDYAACQYPTELNKYGLPKATCGADAVEHRSDRLYVRNVCAVHVDLKTAYRMQAAVARAACPDHA